MTSRTYESPSHKVATLRPFMALGTILAMLLPLAAFAQDTGLSNTDIRRVEDALSWPLVAEQLRAEGVVSDAVGDLIAIGRQHQDRTMNAGLVLESVHSGTVDFGPLPQVSAVVAAIVVDGPRANELRQAIRRAHRESARREGSGETLDGSGIGALVELQPQFERNELGRGQGGGGGGNAHGHDENCQHEHETENTGSGTQFRNPTYEPGQGNQTSTHQPAEDWVPGSGRGRPAAAEEEIILDRPQGQPGTNPAHPSPEEAGGPDAWVPGSGRGGRPGTEHPPGDPLAPPGHGRQHPVAEPAAEPAEQGEWSPGGGTGGGNGQGGGRGLNHGGTH